MRAGGEWCAQGSGVLREWWVRSGDGEEEGEGKRTSALNSSSSSPRQSTSSIFWRLGGEEAV